MTGLVIFAPEAASDVEQAYDWYEMQEPGLGEDFLRCVEACVLLIRRHSRMFPVAADDCRRALIRRFPFEIFYETSDGAVIIYSVFHCSKNPEIWQHRLP